MFLFIGIGDALGWISQIQIHLMFLFILGELRGYNIYKLIQIHLMFLFIHHKAAWQWLTNDSNTSHVLIYQWWMLWWHLQGRDSNTSHVLIYRISLILQEQSEIIQIHLMFLFIKLGTIWLEGFFNSNTSHGARI